jgi:hypothetical protein
VGILNLRRQSARAEWLDALAADEEEYIGVVATFWQQWPNVGK